MPRILNNEVNHELLHSLHSSVFLGFTTQYSILRHGPRRTGLRRTGKAPVRRKGKLIYGSLIRVPVHNAPRDEE